MADEAAAQAPSPARFTARELAAAEQLIHLSESSCSSYAGALPRGSVASASSTSSPRSVNAPPVPLPPATPAPPPPAAGAGLLAAAAEDDEEEEDEDQQEVGGRRRRNKRYRPIAEIYAATEPKPIGAGARRRKADRPRTDAAPEAAGK
ncbi:methionine aminopeptidase 2-1-like [Miscanthus floridulus]|uniref:methionine aminopeptidase 2-1-like n=1 Tax=Miscanthus floridulus TaxID=154761 RepID=UPI0034594388